MKYYDELSILENEIIRFGSVKSLMKMVAESSENCNREDTSAVLWHIENVTSDIHEKMSHKFEELWSKIREDSFNTDHEDRQIDNSENVESGKSIMTELDDIVNSWIRK